MRSVHAPTLWSCENCSKEFSRPDKLKLHMLKHSNIREFMCEACGKQFKRKDKLKEHVKRIHDGKLAMAEFGASGTSFILTINGGLQQQQQQMMEGEQADDMDGGEARQRKGFIPKVEPTDYHRFAFFLLDTGQFISMKNVRS